MRPDTDDCDGVPTAATMSLPCFAAQRVRRRLQAGSSSPVVVETAGGLFVAKLRGAGQGVLALVSEIIVAELAERIGLPVPERALIELQPDAPSDDRNDELADLLRGSIGLNLGFRFLEGAQQPTAQELGALEEEFVARVLWLDGLTMNPDRTDRNPNILLWRKNPWLIDHGAALPFQHDWALVTEDSPRRPTGYATHVFNRRLSVLRRFDPRLAGCLDRDSLATAIAQVPDSFLAGRHGRGSAVRSRAAYHAFLWKRLKEPRPFIPEATDAGSCAMIAPRDRVSARATTPAR
jgi:hypothetical protein